VHFPLHVLDVARINRGGLDLYQDFTLGGYWAREIDKY
jgi:hypothetical protein